MVDSDVLMRRIRSFVRRDSRMTDAQKRAFQTYWPQLGLQIESGKIDFSRIFQREAVRVLEIGFGSGISLLEMAKQNPDEDFIGIETHQPGIGNLLLGMEREQVGNIRIYYADAVDVLKKCIPDESLDVIQIFFPDPWPKRRHRKRRLIQSEFVNLLVTKLKKEGTLHLATDWEDYATQMMQVLSETSTLKNLAGDKQFAERSAQRPVITKFEQRGMRRGHETWDLQFTKFL